jgi:3-hydroxybutyryl-CoA dehydratase
VTGDVATLPPRTVGPVTQTDVVRFAGAGGDFNPLHHDADVARAAGFDPPIAMGQLSAGLLAAYVTDWCGVEHLRSFEVRFTAPLSIGRSITMSGDVTVLDDGSADVALIAVDDLGTTILTGRAEVLRTLQ